MTSRWRWAIPVVSSLMLIALSQPVQASYEGSPDFTNDRVVPLMSSPTDLNSNGSGFLYSSRIVFTSAHTSFNFGSSGERQEFRPFLAVGKPNTDIKLIGQGVRVIKRISAPGYISTNNPDLHDFAILILEKELVSVEPVQLLTPEIERELREKRAEVKLHGYGNIVDLCGVGETLPCSTNRPRVSDVPRAISATLRPPGDFPGLVGYSVPARLLDQLLFFSPGKSSMCGGDSGGSLTINHNGKLMYMANIGTAERIYACGQSRVFDGKGGINYSQPIYKYLDLIKEAELYVATQIETEKAAAKESAEPKVKEDAEAKTGGEQKANAQAAAPKKSTITCIKGKLTKKVTAVKPKCPTGYKKK